MQDVAALESQPLLGFMLKVDSSQKLQFKLYHKNTLYYIFKADDVQTTQRYDIKRGATYFSTYSNNYTKKIFFQQMDRLIQRGHGAIMSVDSVWSCSTFWPLPENVLPQCSLNSAQSIWRHHISCTEIKSKYFIAFIRHTVVTLLHCFRSTPVEVGITHVIFICQHE